MNFLRELVKAWKWLVGKEQEFQVKPTPKRKANAKAKRKR